MAATVLPRQAAARSRLSVALPSPRYLALAGVALAVLAPLLLVLYQSLLSAPFFSAVAHWSVGAYRFVLTQPQFWRAFGTSCLVSAGMVVISVPVGSALAFLLVRTDLPGRRVLEPF